MTVSFLFVKLALPLMAHVLNKEKHLSVLIFVALFLRLFSMEKLKHTYKRKQITLTSPTYPLLSTFYCSYFQTCTSLLFCATVSSSKMQAL